MVNSVRDLSLSETVHVAIRVNHAAGYEYQKPFCEIFSKRFIGDPHGVRLDSR